MNNFNKKIIEKIKKGEIKQESKLEILFKRFSLILSFSISTFISAFFFAFLLRDLTNSFGRMHEIKVANSFFLSNLFWIWLASFLIFIFLSWWNFKKSKNGWKYENYKIILFSILISIILGLLLFNWQISHKIEKKIKKYGENYYHYYQKNKNN